MLDDATIAALAAELHDAQRRRVQVRHFSLRHPGMTIADGYAIQRAWLKMRLAVAIGSSTAAVLPDVCISFRVTSDE